MNGCIISAANLYDFSEIMVIERACFSVPWSEASVLNEITNRNTVFFVLRVDNILTAFSMSRIIENNAELFQIAVSEKFRRLGYAKLLLERTKTVLCRRSVSSLFLEVRKSNAKAQSLYENFGFSIAGLRRGYYENPMEDAIVMELKL